MNFDPQKIFIGLMDFFSILLPGALFVYVTKDWMAALATPGAGFPLATTENVVVFLFGSYLAGHLLFLIGSLLDDRLYDPFRKATENGQTGRLAKGKLLYTELWRDLAASDFFFGRSADRAVTQAVRAKVRHLRPPLDPDAVNAFQWCKARLLKEMPAGLSEVQRFEAASKFFRSLVPTLVLLALYFLFQRGAGAAGLLCSVGAAFAIWRYIDQRFKATQQAYWYVLMLDGAANEPVTDPRPVGGPTHAGGVVCGRGKEGEPVYLLVQAEKDRTQWVLPKGHIEAGEKPRQAAVREVREETGHWARIVGWLGTAPLSKAKGAPVVAWYLMEKLETGEKRADEDRQCDWLTLSQAVKKASFPETRQLLEKADAKWRKNKAASKKEAAGK